MLCDAMLRDAMPTRSIKQAMDDVTDKLNWTNYMKLGNDRKRAKRRHDGYGRSGLGLLVGFSHSLDCSLDRFPILFFFTPCLHLVCVSFCSCVGKW